MFSDLGKIIPGQPRRAEKSDTRQEIRRHDPEQERRQREKRDPKEDPFQNSDTATVSVQALHVFLENFLKSQNNEDQPVTASPAQKPSPKPAGQNAYAASAYQHVAEASTPQTTSMLEDVDESSAPAIKIDASEIRAIHGLLEDLKILEERGVEHLQITRSESFLQSLITAVSAIKNASSFQI